MEQDLEIKDIRSIAGISFLLGIWLVVSPWVFGYISTSARWNQVLCGAGIMLFSLIRYISPRQTWANWTNALLGLWLLIAPFALGYMETATYWNETITALMISVLAFSDIDIHMPHFHRHTHA
jgi:hypothetical protein